MGENIYWHNKKHIKYSLFNYFILFNKVPSSRDIMSSYRREDEKSCELGRKISDLKLLEHLEYEYMPGNSKVVLKRRIPYLENLALQNVRDWIICVSEACKEAKWSETDSVEIILALIRIPFTKRSEYNTPAEIFDDLYEEFFPKENYYLLLENLKKLKQKDFFLIQDYVEAINQEIIKLSVTEKYTKKEMEKRFQESFILGLCLETKVEMTKLNLISKVNDIIKHIKKVEDVLRQSVLGARECHNENLASEKGILSFKQHISKEKNSNKTVWYKKWCNICKSNSHNKSDCFKLKNNVKNREEQNFNKKDVHLQDKNKRNYYLKKENKNHGLLELKTFINKKQYVGVLDCGSEQNFINRSIALKEKLVLQPIKEFNLIFGNGNTCIAKEKVLVKFNFEDLNNTLEEEFVVVDGADFEILLGNEFFIKNNCILDYSNRTIMLNNNMLVMKFSRNDEEKVHSLDDLINTHCYLSQTIQGNLSKKNNFINGKNSIGCFTGNKFKIDIIENKIINLPQYPIALKHKEGVKILLKEFIENGIISYSNSNYASPAFVIEKPNKELRLVVDYRELNNYIIRMPYPFPDIFENVNDLLGTKIYSKLDLKSGFYHIEIEERDREKTSFVILNEQYEFNRMPMGLSNAPIFFQKELGRIFNEFKFVKVFVDDILVCSQNEEEHSKHLNIVLDLLIKYGLKIRLDKSEFFKKEIKFLGLILNEYGYRPDREKFTKLTNLINPKTKKQVMKLLGFLNWFRPFIRNLSEKLKPISDLLKDNTKFIFTEQMKANIVKIFEEIDSDHILIFPDLNQLFFLQCDASKEALGSVLYQKTGVVGYFSYKLKEYETRYTVMEKEILCIYLSLKHFRRIIFGCNIKIFSDNKNILYNKNNISSRIWRWQILISEFNPTLEHIKGADNYMADFLSRIYLVKSYLKDKIRNKTKVILSKYIDNEKYNGTEINKKDGYKLLLYLHDALSHPGKNKLYYTVKEFYKINNLSTICKYITKTCLQCQKNKKNVYNFGLIKGNLAGETIFSKISSDILGPFFSEEFITEFNEKRFWLITFTCTLSKYTIVEPIMKISGKTIKEIFKNKWVELYGKPEQIITDQGRGYISNEFRNFLKGNNIQHIVISSYNPQSNGISERVNSDILKVLRIYKGRKLKRIMDRIHVRLNETYHSVIKCSPGILINGFNIIDINKKRKIIENDELIKNIQIQNNKNNKKQNKLRKTFEFKENMKVLVKNQSLGKLEDIYNGPYEIAEIKNNGNTLVVKDDLENKYYTVNIKNVKLFFERGACDGTFPSFP